MVPHDSKSDLPLGHVHSVVGSSKFSQSSSYEDILTSRCTTCNVAKDLSNYWVPQLYVKKKSDGKFYHVDMDFHVYYKLINDMGQTGPINNLLVPGEIVAFPPGFKMLAGKASYIDLTVRGQASTWSAANLGPRRFA